MGRVFDVPAATCAGEPIPTCAAEPGTVPDNPWACRAAVQDIFVYDAQKTIRIRDARLGLLQYAAGPGTGW